MPVAPPSRVAKFNPVPVAFSSATNTPTPLTGSDSIAPDVTGKPAPAVPVTYEFPLPSAAIA
jgi:hypothetical protein